jgi:predicted short-subunit dehydrogenase-like oxidoreductase (DUF2520 family)
MIKQKDLVFLEDMIDREYASIEDEDAADAILEKLAQELFGKPLQKIRDKEQRAFYKKSQKGKKNGRP